MGKRGRPGRNPYDVLRMYRVYAIFENEDGSFPITYYELGKRITKAFGIMGRAVSPHTCRAMARKIVLGQYARPGREYIRALAKAIAGPYAHLDHPLGEDIVLAKLRAVRRGDGVEYLGWRYMERIFTSRDNDHPYFTIFTYLDETDIAIDVAEMLSLDPAPEIVDALAENIVRRSFRDRAVHGWELPNWIGDFLCEAGKESDMVFAAATVVLTFVSLREKIFSFSRSAEFARSDDLPGLEAYMAKFLEGYKAQGLLHSYTKKDLEDIVEAIRKRAREKT
ncbi:MAG: hypothetical protein WDK95_15375 [Syntrophorhabdaceae bacterium]